MLNHQFGIFLHLLSVLISFGVFNNPVPHNALEGQLVHVVSEFVIFSPSNFQVLLDSLHSRKSRNVLLIPLATALIIWKTKE